MPGTISKSAPPPHIVIFETSLSSSSSTHSGSSILIPCQDGPQRLSGFVKRGRPRKGKLPYENGATDGPAKQDPERSKLDFITYTASPQHAAPTVQRLVRRHAMLHYRRQEREQKGASGEARASRANHTAMHSFVEARDPDGKVLWQDAPDGHRCSAMPAAATIPMLNEISAIDPFDSFPVKLESYMLELLYSYTTSIYETMYTLEKHGNINAPKDYWLPLVFQDAALFHAFIFCASGHATVAQGRKESPQALGHLRNAIQMVNARLQAPLATVTDATIAVVCTFAHTESVLLTICQLFNGNRGNWLIHMGGLKQMLQHRGGIEAFGSNRHLRNKILRADLCGSINAVQSPYFKFVKPLPRRASEAQIASIIAPGILDFSNNIQPAELLRDIVSQLQDITSQMNVFYHQKSQINPLNLREAIISCQYSLLAPGLQQREDTRDGLTCEVLRLGLLMFLVTILDEGPTGAPRFDMLGMMLKSALIEIMQNGDTIVEFSFWLMFMAASVVQDSDLKDYFMTTAAEMMDVLNIFYWDQVESLFRSFFWVDKIHGATLKVLWNALKGTCPNKCKE